MLYIGCDHAGYNEKLNVIEYLKQKNISFVDVGTFSEESVNYPEYAKKVCEKIHSSEDRGILICGSGMGMCMCANKFDYIRAGLCVNIKQATLSRKHNNANVLCLQGRDVKKDKNNKIIDAFLHTKFEGGRHIKRIEMFSKIL